MQIQFITAHYQHPWARQLSVERFARDGIRFCFGDKNLDGFDYCVVYGDLPPRFKLTTPKCRAIFVSGEPAHVYRYSEKFLAQFGTVITSDRQTIHPNCLFMQAGLPWHIGLYSKVGEYRREPMTIDAFRNYAPRKHKLISLVCSDKVFTEGHRKRLSFVHGLREHFGDRMDVFGRGTNTFADKEQVLSPYRYHVALENCNDKDYWTEKISDPILALTYPVYYGCENLEEYLPDGCFTRIDIAQPKRAIEVIETVIASDIAETSTNRLREARKLILDEHNIFALLARVAKKLQSSTGENGTSKSVTLRPNRNFKRKRLFRIL